MSLLRRAAGLAAALLAPIVCALAEPPPVRVTLGARASDFLREVERLGREHGLSCTAEELASATASLLEDEEIVAFAMTLGRHLFELGSCNLPAEPRPSASTYSSMQDCPCPLCTAGSFAVIATSDSSNLRRGRSPRAADPPTGPKAT